jgi:hypothetical protein
MLINITMHLGESFTLICFSKGILSNSYVVKCSNQVRHNAQLLLLKGSYVLIEFVLYHVIHVLYTVYHISFSFLYRYNISG